MKQAWFGLMVLVCCFIPMQPATGKSTLNNGPVNVSVAINNNPDAEGIILYRNGVLLRREDFRARPDEGSIAVAITGSTLGMNYTATRTGDGRLHIAVSVLAGFDPKQSWFKETVRNVPGVLDHEQLHFDITALVACRLRRAIEETSFSPKNFQQELRSLLTEYQRRWQRMEEQYDEESGHGTDPEQQARWADFVRTSLAEEGGV